MDELYALVYRPDLGLEILPFGEVVQWNRRCIDLKTYDKMYAPLGLTPSLGRAREVRKEFGEKVFGTGEKKEAQTGDITQTHEERKDA